MLTNPQEPVEQRAAPRRPAALLLSPVLPELEGTGPAHRAYRWLLALAADYDVHLVVVWRAGPVPLEAEAYLRRLPVARGLCLAPTPRREDYLKWAARRMAWAAVTFSPGPVGPRPEWAFLTPAAERMLTDWLGGRRFERTVCFRMQMLEYARCGVRAGATATYEMDVDDLESDTRRSLAALYWRQGQRLRARRIAWHAWEAARLERVLARECAMVHVAAPEDAAAWTRRFPRSRVAVMPNGPAALPPPLPEADPRRVLFIGSLGYFPNEDAVRFFVGEVLPRLRAEDERWTFVVAGRAAPPALTELLRADRGVELAGAVPEVATVYRRAGIVVAPVRAGGGTKIKVVEAMIHGRPVIATTHAARGWDLREGETFLRADSPAEWVAACRRLADEAELRAKLAAAGREHAQHYLLAAPDAGS